MELPRFTDKYNHKKLTFQIDLDSLMSALSDSRA